MSTVRVLWASVTEVYHIDGDGREQGVVFCEMEGRENTEGDVVDNAIRQSLFHKTGYQWETGGLTKEIAHLSHAEVGPEGSHFSRQPPC